MAQDKDQNKSAQDERKSESAQDKGKSETFFIKGGSVERVVDRLKQLVNEGNIRQVIIKNGKGETIASFPLTAGVTAGVVSVALAPIFAAIAVVAGLVADCSVTVEKRTA